MVGPLIHFILDLIYLKLIFIKFLNQDIGQESKTAEFDDEIKLTPFNMKDELDEGDFDRDGYYHWKKDVGKFLTIF